MSGFVEKRMVCVDDTNYHPNIHPNGVPKRGEVCTVIGESEMGFFLMEYPSYCPIDYSAVGFKRHRFRPIDSLTEQMDRIEEEGAPLELEPEYA